MAKIFKDLLGIDDIKPYLAGTKGLDIAQAEKLLRNDIPSFKDGAKRLFPKLDTMSAARQFALVDLVYNLGEAKVRNKFPQLIDAVNSGDFNAAADQLINSDWYRQVGNRAVIDVGIVRSGGWVPAFEQPKK